MAYEFSMRHRVEFADTDAAGIAHFSAFFRMMEVTEHAFYRSLGFSVHEQEGPIMRGFPRINVSCQFLNPVRFEDELDVQLLVKRKRVKSIEYVFAFRLSGETAAHGSMTVVYAEKNMADRTFAGQAMPARIADQIEQAPAGMLQE